jgi:hypothetical protein
VNEQAVLPSRRSVSFDATNVQDGAGNFCSSRAAQVFPSTFVMDRKLLAGVNGILRISSPELNRRLMSKSADSFRMRRQNDNF